MTISDSTSAVKTTNKVNTPDRLSAVGGNLREAKMTIDRDMGEISFVCDGKRCGDVCYTGEDEWNLAIHTMREEGWVSRQVNGEWEHFCPACQEEDADNQLSEDFDD